MQICRSSDECASADCETSPGSCSVTDCSSTHRPEEEEEGEEEEEEGTELCAGADWLSFCNRVRLLNPLQQVVFFYTAHSPFTPTWSPLPQEDMQFILKTLKDKLTSMGLEKKEVKFFQPWRKKKEQKVAAIMTEPAVQAQDAPKNGWTDVAARRQLAIGINEVTKALERNELKLVLVCKSVKPSHMTSHLIPLSATRGVPACQVPRLSLSVSEPLGLKCVLALGFRQCPSSGEEVFNDTVDAIMPRVPPLNVAWLPVKAPTLTPEGPEDAEETETGDKRGQKRKMASEGEEVTVSPSSCSLLPLTVKKIVPNPAKQRKSKVKKK